MNFQFAQGLFIGRDHQNVNGNCQDAFCILEQKNSIVGIIADGCSKVGDRYTHSEVGAWIGARLQAQAFAARLESRSRKNNFFLENTGFWEAVRADVLAHLRILALQMGDNLTEVVTQFFLFTTVGFIITPRESAFFSIGDGHVFINEGHLSLGPFEDNMPPYLAYGILTAATAFAYQVHTVMPTEDLSHFLIGSDGLDYLAKSENLAIPGKSELVGNISQFWLEDRFFQNSDAINRRLRLINDSKQKVNWEQQIIVREHGHLKDDVVLIVGRRKAYEEDLHRR